jgi:uncharacterized protein (DUF2267 family)
MDAAIHKFSRWIAEIADGLETDDRERALSALRASLHILRDSLPLQATVALGAQLPLIVRGLYYENWQPEAVHVHHTKDEILALLAERLSWASLPELEPAVRAAFSVIQRHIDAHEVEKVAHLLSHGVKHLWSRAA